MKKVLLSVVAAGVLSAGSAFAADMPMVTKAPPPPPPSAWDFAFGAGIYTDYNFRGISQSNHRPSVNAYFEPRYNFSPSLQAYVGLGGWSLEFPNNAAAEIDIYGGLRPTFGKLALDLGVWYYYYPGGRTFLGIDALPQTCTNLFTTGTGFCNGIKGNLSFFEAYAKATYTFNDNWAIGGQFYYDPNWLNSGAPGYYLNGNLKFTGPAFGGGLGWYVSGDIAHYWLGTTGAFYGFTNLPDYTTWDAGIGFTYKVATIDLRYYDTDLSKANCNVLTGDHTAQFSPGNITALNPSGLGSKWCGAAFIASLKVDLAFSNLK